MSVILDENKEVFNKENPKTPKYVFLGTLEEYYKLKKEGKLRLTIKKESKDGNIFEIDPKSIKR